MIEREREGRKKRKREYKGGMKGSKKGKKYRREGGVETEGEGGGTGLFGRLKST